MRCRLEAAIPQFRFLSGERFLPVSVAWESALSTIDPNTWWVGYANSTTLGLPAL
jgi:hypothetical protein